MRGARRGAGAVLALAMVAAAGLAWAASDTAPRLPRPRPATIPPAETVGWANGAATRFQDAILAVDALARLPRPRPAHPALLAMVAPQEEIPEPPQAPNITPAPMRVESDEDFAACLGNLRALGVTFATMEPIAGACSIPHPLNVTALGAGVAISPETVLNCAATRALARWVQEVVQPASARTFDAKLKGIRQDSAFVCRNRYNDPNAKISEHAFANAIDIADFEFAGRDDVGIGTNEAGSPESDFEEAVRAGACRYFTTVLGPGSNAAHATHFHLDLAERKGGYRLCELGTPKIVRGPEKTTRE
jgi:hypothetical protein